MALAGTTDLTRLLVAIANLDHKAAADLLSATPSLATAGLARRDEFFLAERLAQVYEGDTALHAAGFSQRDVIHYLIEAGADPNAAAAGGVTPLHRAARNRCSAAVEALLAAGADPRLPNDRGSTASDLAARTTGRGGTGSAAAKAEQRIIIALLEPNTA